MSFYQFYITENKKKSRTKNIPEAQSAAKELLKNPNNKKFKWLKEKIEHHIERYCIEDVTSFEKECKSIVKSVRDASFYAKPAIKQNQSEKTQVDYLKNRGFNLEKLPVGGKFAYRFREGKFGLFEKEEDKTSHSFDFLCKGKMYDDYIMAKVTTTKGGAQNQQRHEMINIIPDMIKHIESNPNSRERFVLLLDGDNYESSGIDVFKKYESERIYITNCDDYINK
jgi:hypothetical protein